MMKNKFILCVIFMGFLAQNALALPSSSYVDDNGKSWTGRRTEILNGFNVKVEWTVYDIEAKPQEFAWAEVDLPGDKYAYVYKVTNLSGGDIGSFWLLDNPGDTEVIDWSPRINGTQAVGAGIMPDNPSVNQGEWIWSSGNFSTAGATSAYLIFGSIYAPTIGAFRVEPASGVPPIPTPEPGTLALFGIASALYAAKRGRKRQAE